MSHLALRSHHIFDGHRDIGPGIIEVRGPTITAVHPGEAARVPAGAELTDLGDDLITPGLVDVHNHGGGGASFGADPWPAIRLHRSHGSTTLVASLVSQSLDELERQVRMLAPLVADGELAGIHLEGPWLAPGRRGAHPLDALRAPAPDEVVRLLAAGAGAVRMVTLAPELPHAPAAIDLLTTQGVVTAIGHTEADLDTTTAAIDAGARGATHLFNAMPGVHHRAPGPVLGLVSDERVWLELIVDGVHVHPGLVAETFKQYGQRVVLVTDAMAAAGQPDGDYQLGELLVQVRGGTARLADGGGLAGSTLTLDAEIRHAISAGVGHEQALRSATAQPAAYLGLDTGVLAHGRPADLVVWTADWQVARVMRHGQWFEFS
ncbi:MAG: N-acetylglucosamine-6-phosphate deacetylase [Brooklawnia sp.]|jgi:N-acetylglucosamine-6-phosphate deacetylase